MANLQVSTKLLQLNTSGATADWDATEFELFDADGNGPIQEIGGEGSPPDSGLFTNLDPSLGYQYRARVRDANYGWSDWSDNCIVPPVLQPHILAPDISAQVESNTIHLTIDPLTTDTGAHETGSLSIQILDEAQNTVQEEEIADFADGGEYVSRVLQPGTYTVIARWNGDRYGESDWYTSDPLTIEGFLNTLNAQQFEDANG